MASLWKSRSARTAGTGTSRSPGARSTDPTSGATDVAAHDVPAPLQNADQTEELDKDMADMGVVAANVGLSEPSSSLWDAKASASGDGSSNTTNPATSTAATGPHCLHLFCNQASQPPLPPLPAPAPPPPPSALANLVFAFGLRPNSSINTLAWCNHHQLGSVSSNARIRVSI